MTVNGNISIKCIIPPTYDDDDSDDGDDVEMEEGGGNLDVELKITSKDVEANDIYAKEHLYIPHPTTLAKTDIVELLKGYDSRITNNATNIAANTTNIAANKTEIDNLKTTVANHTTAISNNTTNIQNNADEIEKLKKSVSDINGDIEGIDLTEINNTLQQIKQELKIARYGNYQHPVVLLAGKIRKYSYDKASNTYHFEGCKSELITDLTITTDGGTMFVTPTYAENTAPYINAIHVT